MLPLMLSIRSSAWSQESVNIDPTKDFFLTSSQTGKKNSQIFCVESIHLKKKSTYSLVSITYNFFLHFALTYLTLIPSPFFFSYINVMYLPTDDAKIAHVQRTG